MKNISPLFFFVFLCHLAPLFSSIDYISKTKLLSDVDTKYQLASFTNIKTKSRYLDLVFIGDNHKSVTVLSFDARNEKAKKQGGPFWIFRKKKPAEKIWSNTKCRPFCPPPLGTKILHSDPPIFPKIELGGRSQDKKLTSSKTCLCEETRITQPL